MLSDGLFYTGLVNIGLITVSSVILEFIIGFSIAHLFISISDIRASNFLRTIYILPMMVTPVVVGLMWSYILDPLFGIANCILSVFGLPPQPRFSSPTTALWSIVFINVWQWTPFLMLISMTALMSIPKDMYEAAQIDGAKWYHIVTRIELPMIRNTVLVGVIFRIIDGIPLAVWLIASFMRSIHPAIYEAAKIDGCTWGQIFVRIAVPLASGGIATATIFITIFAWNELLLPLFLTDRFAKTFPVVLTSFQGQTEIAWELMCAGATIQVLPIVILTLFVQKYIVSGLTGGAVK